MDITKIEQIKCHDVFDAKISSSEKSVNMHNWKVCAIATTRNSYIPGPFSWTGSFAFLGCPFNPYQWSTATPPVPPFPAPVHFDAFYDWIVSEVGPVNIGDTIEFDMTNTAPPGTPGNAPLDGQPGTGVCSFVSHQWVNKICFEYLGKNTNVGVSWNGSYASLSRDCCEEFDPHIPTKISWDCVKVYPDTTADNPNVTPYNKCIQRNHGNGQFLTKQDCINYGCETTTPIPTPQNPQIKKANKKLKESADYFLKTSLTKFKGNKKKKKKKKDNKKKSNINLSHLDISPKFSNETFEKLKNGSIPESLIPSVDAHCWTIEKVKVNGVWRTPQHNWACKDIQNSAPDTLAGLTAAYSLNLPPYGPPIGGTGWPATIPNTFPPGEQFSMHGPFIVASLCAPLGSIQNPTGFAPGTAGWLDFLRAGPVNASYGQFGGNGPWFDHAYYRSACSSWFHDWVMMAMNGNTPPYNLTPIVGDYVEIAENGPSYINANTIDINLPNDPVEAFCLRYQGRHNEWPEYTWVNPNPHGADVIATSGIESYVEPFMYGDPNHNVEFISCGQEPCEQRVIQYPPEPCGEVGSINPNTGGIVFKTHQGPNADVWYEVAPTDVEMGFDQVSQIPTNILPGGTPDAALETDECFINYIEETTLVHSTSQSYWTNTGPVSTQGPNWTNRLLNDQSQILRGWFAIGIGPGSDNPQINSTNYHLFIEPNPTPTNYTEMVNFDENGSPCALYDWANWPPPSPSLVPCITPPVCRVEGAYFVPANTPCGVPGQSAVATIAAIDLHLANNGAPNPYSPNSNNHPLFGLGNHPFDMLLIQAGPWSYVSGYLANSQYHPWITSNGCLGYPLATQANIFASTPDGGRPVWKSIFKTHKASTVSGWSGPSCEWGVFNQNTPQTCGAGFSGITTTDAVGEENSVIIDNFTQNIAAPYHPTQDTNFVAAEEALIYHYWGPSGYPPLTTTDEKWFLPSLDEFLIIMDAVGPDAVATWNNPLNQTQEHIDFQNSFYNQSDGISKNVYWTSSEDDTDSMLNSSGVSSYTGGDANNFAIAVKLAPAGANTHFPTPLFTSRCHPLTARPIRKYICDNKPKPEYNFRDSHGIWFGSQSQTRTPFVSIYTPGYAGSAASGFDSSGSGTATGGPNSGQAATIGFPFFNMSLASTDVMMNDMKQIIVNPANPHEWKDAFTNIHPVGHPQEGQPNGRNPDGFTISIWDNQKRYLGKWHYAKAERRPAFTQGSNLNDGVRINRIDWRGYVTDCGYPGLNNPIPGTIGVTIGNCNGSPTYTTFREEFPDMVGITFSEVTYLEEGFYGNEPILRYGQNREAAARGWFGPGITAANPGVIFNSDWSHPYMENVFNGWDASYAYIKVECQTTQNIGANAFNLLDGPNTDIDAGQVVCMKNLFEDRYLGIGPPPNPDLLLTTGSILGCGDISNHFYNNTPFPGGYGWQQANPLLKGNSAFGDLYGINYVDGRRQEPNYSWVNPGPNLALHPKHWAFIWFAVRPPNSGGVNWYNDLHEGYKHCYGYRCKWDIGDIGPAGGIIVGVPGMVGDETVVNGASTNDSEWYYEMSPEDLGVQPHTLNTPIEFGAWNSWIPYPNIPCSADQTGPWSPVWPPFGYIGDNDEIGGNINQGFKHYDPYTPTGSGYGATTIFPGGFCELNPIGGPHSVPSAQNAHKLCQEYETFDQFGNRYCDWYLPNIQESWYIMNNAPVGTFPVTVPLASDQELYWTSNRYDSEPGDNSVPPDTQLTGWPGWDTLTHNTMYDQGGGAFLKGVINPTLDRTNAAYAYNVAENVVKGPSIPLTNLYLYSPHDHGALGFNNNQPWEPYSDAVYMVFDATDMQAAGVNPLQWSGSTLPPPFDILGNCAWIKDITSPGLCDPTIQQLLAPGGVNSQNDISSAIVGIHSLSSYTATHMVRWGGYTTNANVWNTWSPPIDVDMFGGGNFPNYPGLGNSYADMGSIGVSSSTHIQNWHTLSDSTKATYVVRKDMDLKVRAIRRFKCPPPPGPWRPSWPPH